MNKKMNPTIIFQIGFALIFIGIFLIIFSSIFFSQQKDSKFAVVGVFGFIPFGISNDKRLLYFSFGLLALFLVLYLVFFYLSRK
jgi:uncharacterized membrane protein